MPQHLPLLPPAPKVHDCLPNIDILPQLFRNSLKEEGTVMQGVGRPPPVAAAVQRVADRYQIAAETRKRGAGGSVACFDLETADVEAEKKVEDGFV